MTGPEHYREAERLMREARPREGLQLASWMITEAQVHATLALAAATGLARYSYGNDNNEPSTGDPQMWFKVAGTAWIDAN